MNRAEFDAICDETFAILGERFDSVPARAALWAIGRQESRLEHRDQVDRVGDVLGPALGLWQFERGGGVKGVLTHKASKKHALALREARGVTSTPREVWVALKTDDILACGFARLLLFTDPAPLPPARAGAEQEAWAYYKRNWRPGRPHRHTWGKFWLEAVT